jgi:cytochrome b involved in lipid metabolism
MPYSSVSNESLSLSIDDKTVDYVRMTEVKMQIEETYLETEHHHEGEEKKMNRCLPLYTREEIFKHNKEEDGWFIFDGAVFDATSHLKEIKDKKTSTFLAIVRVLGKDCTHEMQEIGHSARALAQMQTFKIGEVM